MTRNEGTLDRAIRLIIGLVLLYVALFTGTAAALAVLLGVVGAVLVLTAAVGFCPLYAALGIRTCPLDKR